MTVAMAGVVQVVMSATVAVAPGFASAIEKTGGYELVSHCVPDRSHSADACSSFVCCVS